MTLFVVGLTLAASLSPLLTFAHLFQLKEWRWDRLREHLRETGWNQLCGTARPLALLIIIILFQIPDSPSATSSGPSGRFQIPVNFQLTTLIVFTLLNVIQIITKCQPCPVWTRKAITLIGTSLLIATFFSFLLTSNEQRATSNFIVALPLLQPLILALALALLSPLDFFLKRRILHKATILRSQFPHLVVIGITGSVGKTTTKELLAHILGPERALATPEHVNSELGVAQWLIKTLGTSKKHAMVSSSNHLQTLIVEMGAYRQGEIATICAVAQPTMGIVTSIGTQHIGLFGSQRAIAEAKSELFAALPPSGHAFVNVDTPYTQELRKKCTCPITTVSPTASPADIQATHMEETVEGLRFHLTRANEPTSQRANFTIPLHGEHQLGNILLAIATTMELGIPLEEIAQKLQTFQPPQHTFSIRQENGITILDDTHNASPESFRAAIEWARHQPHARKILITPGIIEQGLSSARVHFQCGTLAKDVFDEAFVLNKKFAQFFAEGFGKPVSYNLKPNTYRLKPGSLLTCVGRIPQSTIQKLLS